MTRRARIIRRTIAARAQERLAESYLRRLEANPRLPHARRAADRALLAAAEIRGGRRG